MCALVWLQEEETNEQSASGHDGGQVLAALGSPRDGHPRSQARIARRKQVSVDCGE